MLINDCQSYSFYTRRFISGIRTKFSCVLHTQELKHATYKHMRCAEYMHVQYCMHTAYIISATLLHTLGMYTAYILHTYCIYICYHIRHVYSIHTAYVHTCTCNTCMLHACCTHNTSILHACCIHKNWLSATLIPYKHEEMYAACMLYINNCMYAAHNNCTRVAYMYSYACDLMCMYVACVWR